MFSVKIKTNNKLHYGLIERFTRIHFNEFTMCADLRLMIRELEVFVKDMSEEQCKETFERIFELTPWKPTFMHLAFLYELFLSFYEIESIRMIITSQLALQKDAILHYKKILREKYNVTHTAKCLISGMFRCKNKLEDKDLVIEECLNELNDDMWYLKEN
jgi:hypothetical protein